MDKVDYSQRETGLTDDRNRSTLRYPCSTCGYGFEVSRRKYGIGCRWVAGWEYLSSCPGGQRIRAYTGCFWGIFLLKDRLFHLFISEGIYLILPGLTDV